MDLKHLEKDRKTFANRLVIVSALLGLSIASNLVLSLQVLNNSKVILVPTLPQSASIDTNGRVSREYLEFLTRDMAWLFLNRTSETAHYLETQAQGLIDPTVYEALRLELSKQSRVSIENHSTQSFSPDDIYLDPANLYAEIRGTLEITSGKEVVDTQEKVFAMKFSKHGSQVLLYSIKEIDPKEAKGESVKPAMAGTEQ